MQEQYRLELLLPLMRPMLRRALGPVLSDVGAGVVASWVHPSRGPGEPCVACLTARRTTRLPVCRTTRAGARTTRTGVHGRGPPAAAAAWAWACLPAASSAAASAWA